tara:strand:- start:8018 stop:9019 length:1002 start_codon:yes stop_codon:yes gene_type:complete
MGHAIAQTRNGDYMTAWQGDTPWHGLGTSVSGLMTAEEALSKAHLDWNVIKKPLSYENNGLHEVIPNTFGAFREDGDNLIPLTRGKALGKVWKPLQNIEAFSFLDDLMQNQEAKIEVCGALGNGERVWALAKMPNSVMLKDTDKIDQYVLISNTHDGSGAVRFLHTPIRVVCANTLTWALQQGRGQGYNIRHTGKMGDRVDDAREAMGFINEDFLQWGEMASDLLTVEMDNDDRDEYFVKAFGLSYNDEGDLTTRSENILDKARTVLTRPTNQLNDMGNTAWGAYNAVTETIDHEFTKLRNGEKSLKRMESTLFGPFAKKKQGAWKLAYQLTQ